MVDRVALFVRAPVLGKVKSRLARSIGVHQALAAHETLALHALNKLSGAEAFSLEIWASEPHPNIDCWCAQFQLPQHVQCPGDLGARMSDALTRLCTPGGVGGKGIIVGSDCPSVDVPYIRGALEALESADLVLGPAEDGGYGLIGIARLPVADVFSGVSWGGSEVLAQTLMLADAAGLRTTLLPAIWDVDEIADWRRFQNSR